MIYEYKCAECEQVSEFIMKMADPHPEECPHCGAKGSLERIISQSSFSLKGSGWYVTDYKRKGSSGGDSGSSAGGSKSGSCSTT